MERLLERPGRTLVWTFVACTAGFFSVGWLASIDRTGALSWEAFDPALGFAFAAAFAQLVLAGVVWAQISGANAALAFARRQAVGAAERERDQRAADSLATFVGLASNASAVYGNLAKQRARDAVMKPGDIPLIEAAKAAIADADQVRQAAHAERFHVAVRTSVDGSEIEAVARFLDLLDSQHRRAVAAVGWSSSHLSAATAPPPGSQGPDTALIYQDASECRRECLGMAATLVTAATETATS